jgi:hypothetical protein
MYTDDLSIEDAWVYLCESLLNDTYGRNFNKVMTFIPRGTVSPNGDVLCTGMSNYVLRQVRDHFRLPDSFQVVEGHGNVACPTEEQKGLLRCLYLPTSYLHTLPWHVLQMMAANTTKEGKKASAHMWQSRGALTKKRLGALASLPQLQ